MPLRSLLTRPVVVSIANYGTLALLEIAASALIPLIWSTAIELGGLGLTPASIGLWMSAYGCVSVVFQFAFFPRIIARFGPGRVVVATAVSFGVLYILFPFENMLARASGTATGVWPLIVLQLVSLSVTVMGFSKSFALNSVDPTLIVFFALRLGVHVCFFRRAKQAIPWRHERSCADGCLDPAYGRTRRRHIALRLFPAEQFLGWSVCVRGFTFPRVCWAGCGRTASEGYLEASGRLSRAQLLHRSS